MQKQNVPWEETNPCASIYLAQLKCRSVGKNAWLIIRGNSKVSVFLLPIGKNGIITIASFNWIGFPYARYAPMFGKNWDAVMAAQKYLLSWNWFQNREHTPGFNKLNSGRQRQTNIITYVNFANSWSKQCQFGNWMQQMQWRVSVVPVRCLF